MSESSVCFPNSEYIDKYNVQYFKENPDCHNPKFNNKFGAYSEGCGLDNVLMSWGHDDYMYLVAKENKTTLPSAGLFIIRYHSFYRKLPIIFLWPVIE
jgi:inositol oxygenase